jgi:hypothetical protein
MAKLVIQTQIRENYGTALRPHWKAKGGEDYVVSNFTQFNDVQSAIDSLREQVETDNDFYQEYIVCWNVVDNDYLTDYERQQLEFDGRITYPAQELVVVDLQEN